MQDILGRVWWFWLKSCYKARSERKTLGAYHIFVMRMQQTELATFQLGGISKGLSETQCQRNWKKPRNMVVGRYLLYFWDFFVRHENYCNHLKTPLRPGWQRSLFFFKTEVRKFLLPAEDTIMWVYNSYKFRWESEILDWWSVAQSL